MVCRWCILLGAGLLVLGLSGIFASPGPGSWLPWCDLLGAWAAYFLAADIKFTTSRAKRIGGTFALSVGLFVACLATSGNKSWLTWPTFAMACGFLVLGVIRWVKKEVLPKGSICSEDEISKPPRSSVG